MRSIRSCSRARAGNQRGFALIWAIGLALLFFLLIELMLIDSARELSEARRFRSRMVAQTLAENAAELAAVRIVDRDQSPASAEDWQGKMTATMQRNIYTGEFTIEGEAETAGTEKAKARIEVYGMAMTGKGIEIRYTVHTP